MTYLDDLLSSTRRRIADAQSTVTVDAMEQRIASMEKPRGFAAALRGEQVAIIAEIKRATPRAGDLNVDLNAGELARDYAGGEAAAISVLTEPEGFKGSLEDLVAARDAGLPVLRKDFIVDAFQVFEARAHGADAVLVIVRILEEELLGPMVSSVESLGMDALVEVHDEPELERALAAGASVIGINHRDLATFEVDPERTAKLAPLIPDDRTIVGLSGVSTRDEVEALQEAGAHAVLVGEALVTASDPVAKLRELRGVA
jgi:indole-3-glycerol phosphate synthase